MSFCESTMLFLLFVMSMLTKKLLTAQADPCSLPKLFLFFSAFTNTCCMWAVGSFFPVVLLCQFFGFWREIGFGFTYLYTQSTIQLWCYVSFLVLAGNSFWCYIRTQCTIQLCRCVSFLVVAGNSSQNENMFLQKNLIGLLYQSYIESVFSGRYQSVFLGIYHTDTKGNLGRYILVSFFWRIPLLPSKRGHSPLF